MKRYGYNVLKVDNTTRDRLWNHCAKLPSGVMLFYNSQGDLAWTFKHDFPDWIVIHRSHPDHLEWTQVSPSEFYRRHANRARDGVIIHTQNEVGFLDEYLNWSTELTRIARPDGTRFVHLNLAVGHPEPDAWKRPASRRFLEEIAKDGKRHYVGLHEYWPTNVTGFVDGTTQQNPVIIDRKLWPETIGDAYPAWLCGRWYFLHTACENMNIPTPQILLTEVGTAGIGAVDLWQKALPKTPPYTDLDGWKASREAWRAWWSDWTHEQAYAEQMLYALRVLWSGVEGVCVFGYGDSGGWSAFNVDSALEYQARMEAGLRVAAPTPPPPADVPFPPFDDDWWPATIVISVTANLRRQPTIAAGNIVKQLPTGVYQDWIAPNKKVYRDGYEWYPISFGSLGVEGWLRSDVFNYVVLPEETPLPDDSITVRLTKSEAAALKTIASKLA